MARTKIACPICKKPVLFDSPEMPFCSERCRLIDLGNWATEKYRAPVSGQIDALPGDDDEESEVPEGSGR